ncbi:MAG: porin [Verrucomicrobiota bacterium]|jgi:porin
MAIPRRAKRSAKIVASEYLVPVLIIALATKSFSQDAVNPSQPEGSMLQPEMEVEEVEVPPGAFSKADHLTGDWWGYRERLYASGVEVFAFYNSIFSGNVVGGFDPGHATYVDDAYFGFKFDLEKLFGWQGGQISLSGVNRNGTDLTHKYIGSIYSTQQMVGGQRLFLYQLYLQQKVFANQLMFKVGRFGASDDFNASPLYGYSLNNGVDGDIRNVLFDTRFSAYPFATWAAALFYDPTPEFNAKIGVFQVSEGMFENDDNGLNFGIGNRDGYTLIGQFGWSPDFFKRAVASAGDVKNPSAPVMKGMPGHYWFGFTYSQWDLYRRFNGGFEDHSYGFYAHADQLIYQEAPGSDEGLVVFVASGYYPQKEISIVPFQVNVGLNYKGLFPHRDADRTLLFFIDGEISSDYARSVRRRGRGLAESEKVIEFGHRFQLTRWSYFQPDIQYVMDPGGTGDIADAVVIGAQMGLTF